MKKISLALLLAMLLPASAQALDTRDVVALAAMPLAVAAVSELSGVPTGDLVDVVVAMNRANVPPPQFIEVVRYVPVALVEQQPDQPFVAYVNDEIDRGVLGADLAYAMGDRIETYGVTEINVVEPPTVVMIERQQFVPTVVATRFNAFEVDPLELIAMPLAVAAVADLVDFPRSDLMQLVSTLNDAYVRPAQFVEIVRYSPAVFYDDRYQTQFIPYVRTQYDSGLIGDRLALAIADRYDDWGVDGFDLRDRDIDIVDHQLILPPIVHTRVASSHPHGGPPGQLKKQLGLQTGAEVVHGSRLPARVVDRTVERDRGIVAQSDRPGKKAKASKSDRQERRAVRAERAPKKQSARVERAPQRQVTGQSQRVDKPKRGKSVDRGGGSAQMKQHGNSGTGGPARQGGGQGGGKGQGKGKGKG
jgi:hypothetical protein